MSSVATPQRFCRNHPDRDGVGVCRQCRAVVCAECSTKIDGINFCVNCLALRQRSATAAPIVNRASERVAAWAALPLLWIATVVAVLLAGWLLDWIV